MIFIRRIREMLLTSLLVKLLLGTLAVRLHANGLPPDHSKVLLPWYASGFVVQPQWTTTESATVRRLTSSAWAKISSIDDRSRRRQGSNDESRTRHEGVARVLHSATHLHSRNDFESTNNFADETELPSQKGTEVRVEGDGGGSHRRQVLRWMVGSTLSSVLLGINSNNANARGLVQFPCLNQPLLNTYHLMRSGLSLLEQNDIWNTNPLFLTNREDALSALGEKQVVEACQKLKSLRQTPTVVRYSLAASCMDAATIVSRELKLGRDRVVAEYTYLDPRAIGQWDTMSFQTVQPAVWAMDEDEGKSDGTGGRPPPNDDGTPNETLADQAVRLRQLLSVLETLYSGDTVLLIFPDGTGPALLSALMAGIPLNQVHQLEYQPGEVRLNVTGSSTLTLYQMRQQQEDYQASYQLTLNEGRQTLQTLRNTPREAVISRKDELMEQERLALEAEFQQQQQEKQELREAQDAQRLQRQQRIEAASSVAGQSDKNGPPSSVILGLAGAVAVGGIAVAVAPSSPPSKMKTNSIQSSNVNDTIAVKGSLDTLAEARNFTSSLYSTSPVTKQERVNGDGTTTSTVMTPSPRPIPLTVEERKVAARVAMDDYLNRDDGAQDWLQSLADIIQEEEEEEDGDIDA